MSQELLQGIGIAAIFIWWIWVTISTFGVFDMQAQINRLRGRTGEWDSQRRADLAMLEQRIERYEQRRFEDKMQYINEIEDLENRVELLEKGKQK